MTDLRQRFATAANDAQHLPARPDNEVLLQLYALYKQASVGDVAGARPGFTDFVGRAKYDAWVSLKGASREDAMQRYIDLVNKLKQGKS